jgi:hypothetical protein
LQRWTWRWRHNHYFWQDSTGNMLNPVVGLLEFIAEGPAVAALQRALLPSSKLEAATIENYQVNIALGRPHAGRQQQGRQGGDRTDCARANAQAAAQDYVDAIASYAKSWSLVTKIADDPVSDSRAGRGYFSPMKPEPSRPSVKQVERINL